MAEEIQADTWNNSVEQIVSVEQGVVRGVAPMLSKDAQIEPLQTWDQLTRTQRPDPRTNSIRSQFDQMFALHKPDQEG